MKSKEFEPNSYGVREVRKEKYHGLDGTKYVNLKKKED